MTKNAWNGVERRHGWSADVDTQLAEGKRVMDELRADLATNTAATARIEASTNALVRRGDDVDKKLTPIFEAWDTLQTGLRVLGAIGKFGLFVVKHWMILVGALAFLWAITHGATVEDAIKEFWKGASREP